MPNGIKRELIWLGVAVLAGFVVLPLLVYATGTLTLGGYSRGGPWRFLADFLRSIAGLEWQALVLAAAPIALVLGWRIVRAVRVPRPDGEYVDARAADRDAPVRREPTL